MIVERYRYLIDFPDGNVYYNNYLNRTDRYKINAETKMEKTKCKILCIVSSWKHFPIWRCVSQYNPPTSELLWNSELGKLFFLATSVVHQHFLPNSVHTQQAHVLRLLGLHYVLKCLTSAPLSYCTWESTEGQGRPSRRALYYSQVVSMLPELLCTTSPRKRVGDVITIVNNLYIEKPCHKMSLHQQKNIYDQQATGKTNAVWMILSSLFPITCRS